MGDNRRIAIPWSDLPTELLEEIVNHLHTETDVRRVRAVCRSWRYSTAPFKKLPATPLNLPFPFGGDTLPEHDGAYFTLIERTVYRVETPECKTPNFWLVKTEAASEDGKLRILNPLSHREIKIPPGNQMPKVLNTLDFRVSEVCNSHALRYVNPCNPNPRNDYKFAKKVVVAACADNEYAVMAIDENYELWYIKSNDEKWTMVRGEFFLDIITCNKSGEFRGVDYYNRVWFFNSKLEVVSEVTPITDLRSPKVHMLQISDELFLIEELTDKYRRKCTCRNEEIGCQCKIPIKHTAVEIGICRFDEENEEFVEVDTAAIGGRIIFAGDDCSFSVSAQGVNRGRVFYTDKYICFRTGDEKNDDEQGFNYVYGYVDIYDDTDCGFHCNRLCVCCYPTSAAKPVDEFVPNDDVKTVFRGLNGHNSGVCDFETGELGSLLMFPHYADVFWPPPSWLSSSRRRS
ncbi:hypothetical protein ACP275_06G067200 [Erythranthe tilingii]